MLGLVQRPVEGTLPSVEEPLWSRLGRGQLLGWAAVGIVDAIVLDLTLPPRHGELVIRAFHHLYDLGQVFAAGLLSAAAVEAFEHVRSRLARRYVRGWVPLALAAIVVGALVLPEDLGGLVRRMPGPHRLWEIVMVGAFSLVIPLLATGALALVERAGRDHPSAPLHGWARWSLALTGLVIAVTNHFVLQYDYGGLHLFASWAAAILVGVASGHDARGPGPGSRIRGSGSTTAATCRRSPPRRRRCCRGRGPSSS